MIREKKHIVFFLLGIFIFPVLFKSFHFIWHQSHIHHVKQCWYSVGTSNGNCQFVNETETEEEKVCPICEYQFSITNYPKISFFKSIIHEFILVFNGKNTQQINEILFASESPRAPPLLIL